MRGRILAIWALWGVFCPFGLTQVDEPEPRVSCGSLVRLERFPSAFVDARHVDVWLPEGYDTASRYPVLYMHDGQMLFDSSVAWRGQEWGVDEVLCAIHAKKLLKDCIVVGIWNNGDKRPAEFFPQKAIQYLSETGRQALATRTNDIPLADAYLKFLVFELKPTIDQQFATLPDRKNTFVAGSSMGGLISMYAICEYPGVFGAAACLSTHWPVLFYNENNPIPAAIFAYMKRNLPPPKEHRLYFDYGTENLDALYAVWQKEVDKLMCKKQYRKKTWKTLEFPGASHTPTDWNKRLHVPLAFLLKTN